MTEKVSSAVHKVTSLFIHDPQAMYDDPGVFGERPVDVPGSRIVEIDVPEKLTDDEYMISEMTSEEGKIAVLASELHQDGHVVGVAKASYNKVRVLVGKHPYEVAGALGVAATVGAGIILHHEFKREKKPTADEGK